MEKQELFDNYILGKLSSDQIADFENKLKADIYHAGDVFSLRFLSETL